MKAIVINPKEKTVTDIKIGDELQEFYKVIGCRYITSALLNNIAGIDGNKLTLYVDDEGLFAGEPHFFEIKGAYGELAGIAIMLGHDGEGGSCDCPLKADDIREEINWLT